LKYNIALFHPLRGLKFLQTMLLISTNVTPASRARNTKPAKRVKQGQIKYIRGHETQTREAGETTIETEHYRSNNVSPRSG
jgi:hypothetical protein